MDFELVTDSSCNLTESMIEDFGIHILPLIFTVDNVEYQSYLKGEKTDLKQLMYPQLEFFVPDIQCAKNGLEGQWLRRFRKVRLRNQHTKHPFQHQEESEAMLRNQLT